MNQEKEALIIIDMLKDFVEEGGALYCGPAAKAIIPHIQEQLARARSQGVPVIYACDRHVSWDSEFQLFKPHCVVNSEGAEICSELRPLPDDIIIYKRRYSAFFGTDLDLTLRELQVTHLTLTGVCTNICVLYTAADAVMLGYKVTVPSRCVASFNKEAHEFALRELKETLGANVK